MAINSATDHGFNHDWSHREVYAGDIIRLRSALGLYEVRVARRYEPTRYVDRWETVFDRWVSDVPAFRQGFLGTVEVHKGSDLLQAKYAA